MKKLIPFIIFSIFSINVLHSANLEFLQNADLYGDIRTRWISEWGVDDDHTFKAEARVGCDYTLPRTWISVKMKASTSNGKESLMFLDKAFLGYQLINKTFENSHMGLGVEIGRNKMDSMFDSKLQFNSYFNGLHVIYSFKEEGILDFTLHGGPHVIDSNKKHYGWIMESVWRNVANSGITLKYSLTDWNAPLVEGYYDERYYYCISQVTANFDFDLISVYGAYLCNHQQSMSNDGFYIGFSVGHIRKPKDFMFDINFQSTKYNLLSPTDQKGVTKGVEIKLIYALAARLNLETKFSRHDADNNNRLEFQAIYSW